MVKVSDEHTFLVCGGMIEEDQFVSLLQGIQIDLVKKNPGQGFENIKWRYEITFKGDTFNDLSDVYDDLLQDLENLNYKNPKRDFIRDINSLMTKYPNRTSDEYIYLDNLFKRVEKIPYRKFDITRMKERVKKDKSTIEHKATNSGNIGYLWVSDSLDN
jgi:hypothetical protein